MNQTAAQTTTRRRRRRGSAKTKVVANPNTPKATNPEAVGKRGRKPGVAYKSMYLSLREQHQEYVKHTNATIEGLHENAEDIQKLKEVNAHITEHNSELSRKLGEKESAVHLLTNENKCITNPVNVLAYGVRESNHKYTVGNSIELLQHIATVIGDESKGSPKASTKSLMKMLRPLNLFQRARIGARVIRVLADQL